VVIRVTFDTCIWRSLGPKGIIKLHSHLDSVEISNKIEIWGNLPCLYETVTNFINDGNSNTAAKITELKRLIYGNRIILEPKRVIEMLISEKYKLPFPQSDIKKEKEQNLRLSKTMMSESFLKKNAWKIVKKFNDDAITHTDSINKLAEFYKEQLGDRAKEEELIDELFHSEDYCEAMGESLSEIFNLSPEFERIMSVNGGWTGNDSLKFVLMYLNAKIKELILVNRHPQSSDLMDFYQFICSLSVDKFVTNNTHDFQDHEFLSDRLWTWDKFKLETKFEEE